MSNIQKNIVLQTEEFVKSRLSEDTSGHDFWHVQRVRKMALFIAGHVQNCDVFVVEMASLLHDVADYKLHGGDDKRGIESVQSYLGNLQLDDHITRHIIDIIGNMSFRKSFDSANDFSTSEMRVVQDADRLDAIGAIGIARCFSYGGARGNALHIPGERAQHYASSEEYKKTKSTSINHFYEKLLKLKDMMNTDIGRSLAEKRHAYMESYLKEFFDEWDGKR